MQVSRILFLAVLGGAPLSSTVAAWSSPAGHNQRGNFLSFTRTTTGSSTDKSATTNSKRRGLVVLSVDRDNAMDAYEQAMQKMAAARPPPSPPAAAVAVPSQSTAAVAAPSQTTAATTNGNGMHAYEQYFQNANTGKDSNLPNQPYGSSTSMNGGTGNPPPFLESTLNNPTWSEQEKSNLETAKTWTATKDSASTNFAPPFAYPKEEPSTEQPPTEQPPLPLQETTNMNSFEAQYASFMKALAPNSETKIPPPPAVALEDWTPPLDLDASATTDTTATKIKEEAQTQQPPPPQVEQQASTTTIRETQMQPTPYIPSLRKKTDDFAAVAAERDAAKDAAMNIASSFAPSDSSSESFLSTTWDEQGTKKNKKRPSQSFTTTNTAETIVKPGVTKRVFESLNFDNSNPRVWSPWDAFQNAGDRWEDLKNAKPFKYDFKLFKPIQNEKGPPLQFVSDDCAMGNAKGCSKLRAICEASPDVECTNLDYEGPPLDDSGQPIMDFDIIVLGGTLGIFYARALQLKGLNVCVAAPRELRGQDQEWNVSMEDLLELKALGILSQEDIDASITTKYGGTRTGFKNKEVTPLKGGPFENRGVGYECYVNEILNLGVSPAILIDRVATRFKKMGGIVRERCPLKGVAVSTKIGCAVDLGSYDPNEDVEPITSKLVLDCMGYGSPVARQQRYGVKPDSICMVFGSCASGYNPDRNLYADMMYSFNPLQDFGDRGKHQYFWESFPVGTKISAPVAPRKPSFNMFESKTPDKSAEEEPQVTSGTKTTFMFTYIDAHQKRPSLEELFEDYWKLLPKYQGSISDPEKLDIKRVVYDYFPAYRDSPMKTEYSRVLSVGESSGIQSPISFGGFRSLSRHIGRITGAIAEAVETGCLHKDDLGEINAYLPNLSAAWLFRDLMAVPMGKDVKPEFVNRVLAVYLKAMYDLGPETVSPFFSDVLCYDALAGTLFNGAVSDPSVMGELVKHVGMPKVLEFLDHVRMMGYYSFLDKTYAPIVRRTILKKETDPRIRFQWNRRMEAWKYGSGNDYMERKKKRK